MTTCSNCGATLIGEFCQDCGQKRFVESDRRFGHLLHELLVGATDLDGRIWRTVRALLFQPGLLSQEYFAGRRARWISPVSLFLAVSVVYFLAPMRGGDLTLQFNQQVSGQIRALARAPEDKPLSDAELAQNGQAHTRFTSRWIEQRVQARDAAARAASNGPSQPSLASGALGLLPGAVGYSYHDYRVAYDAKADDVSKALVILHVPFAALALMLLFFRQHRYFAEHFVFALHFFAFWMIALQVVSPCIALMHSVPAGWALPDVAFDWFMRALLPTYAILAVRRAYGSGWAWSILAAFGMLAVIVAVNIYIYRAVQFAVTFALT